MILVLSNTQDVTADYFCARLNTSHIPFVRLDTQDLLDQRFVFAAGNTLNAWFWVGAKKIFLDTITAVYYRRPVPPQLRDGTPPGVARWIDSEVRHAWGGLLSLIPKELWVNHPLAISGANYKPEQLARAAAVNFSVPESLVTNDIDAAQKFCDHHHWNIVAKPIGHGEILGDTSDDDYLIYTNTLLPFASLTNLQDCPAFFQQHIQKDADLRVTVVGDAVHVVELHSQENECSQIDCRRENMQHMRYSTATLPDDLAEMLIRYVRSYGLLYGAIDLVRDQEGTYWFLELNPAGQWAWLEQLGHADISGSLIEVLTNAYSRYVSDDIETLRNS